jgi:beta-alanine degradation protein BauB
MMSGTAKATKLIDNDRVTVWEWRFQHGQNTGWHRHGHDYIVVPLIDGRVKLETKDGTSFAEMKAGSPYFRSEGVEHDVISDNPTEFAFIEIELKP